MRMVAFDDRTVTELYPTGSKAKLSALGSRARLAITGKSRERKARKSSAEEAGSAIKQKYPTV
jgi:hypothetical protein